MDLHDALGSETKRVLKSMLAKTISRITGPQKTKFPYSNLHIIPYYVEYRRLLIIHIYS